MRKIIYFIGLAFCIVILTVSCGMFSTAEEVQKLSEVKFIPRLLDSKKLDVSDVPSYTWLEYNTGDDIWTRISTKEQDGTFCTQAVFASGHWNFAIRLGFGTGDDSAVVYTGETSCYITDSTSTVYVDMYPYYDDEATGNLTISVSSPALNSSAGEFAVKLYSNQAMTDYVTDAYDGSQNINFNSYSIPATVESSTAKASKTLKLKPGVYFVSIQYKSESDESDKAVAAFKIIGDCTSVLSGTLNSGSFSSTGIGLQFFDGTLTNSSGTITFTPSGDFPGTVTYTWFVNGIKMSDTDNSYSFTQTAAGSYCITCIAVNLYEGNEDVVCKSITIKV